MIEIKSQDYIEYAANCEQHGITPIRYTEWMLKARRVNYIIAKLFDAFE